MSRVDEEKKFDRRKEKTQHAIRYAADPGAQQLYSKAMLDSIADMNRMDNNTALGGSRLGNPPPLGTPSPLRAARNAEPTPREAQAATGMPLSPGEAALRAALNSAQGTTVLDMLHAAGMLAVPPPGASMPMPGSIPGLVPDHTDEDLSVADDPWDTAQPPFDPPGGGSPQPAPGTMLEAVKRALMKVRPAAAGAGRR